MGFSLKSLYKKVEKPIAGYAGGAVNPLAGAYGMLKKSDSPWKSYLHGAEAGVATSLAGLGVYGAAAPEATPAATGGGHSLNLMNPVTGSAITSGGSTAGGGGTMAMFGDIGSSVLSGASKGLDEGQAQQVAPVSNKAALNMQDRMVKQKMDLIRRAYENQLLKL